MKLLVDEMAKRPQDCPFIIYDRGQPFCKNDGRICGIRPGDHCRWLTVSKEIDRSNIRDLAFLLLRAETTIEALRKKENEDGI